MAVRVAVRVLLLDEDDRVLLVRYSDGARSWWCTPGGGTEPGESDPEAAARELREEVGLDSVELGPCIWVRRHAGVFRGRPFDQSERIYLARVEAFEAPVPGDDAVGEGIDAIQWWTISELSALAEDVAPRDLAVRLRALLDEGPPATPVAVGV